MKPQLIPFYSNRSVREYKSDNKFENLTNLYELRFMFEDIEYIFNIPEDTLLEVKESDSTFKIKTPSDISIGDEVLILSYELKRIRSFCTCMSFNCPHGNGIRKSRVIEQFKHLVKVSSISVLKEKVKCSSLFPIVAKYPENITSVRPIPVIPVNTICEEWIDN